MNRRAIPQRIAREYYLTSSLGLLLEQAKRGLGLAKRLELQGEVAARIDFYREQVSAIPETIRPDVEHKAIDDLVRVHPKLGEVTCRKGCSACCHTTVQVTNAEAKQLAGLVHSGAVQVDRALLEEQASFMGDEFEWWKLPLEKRRCPFLGADGACAVYDKRPTTCRKYYVSSPAEDCAKPGGRPLILGDFNIEIMASGFADLDQNQDPLPKSLHRELVALEASACRTGETMTGSMEATNGKAED